MTSDPLLLTGALAEANDRLLRTVSGLTAADVAAPSLLPGWTRAHVLTHLARNADGFVNLLTSARTGEEIPMYASAQA
ncbi:maleylpyruvate isomerase N-terminal domain-containing protein, partial [Micromonospora tulbaghiae]